MPTSDGKCFISNILVVLATISLPMTRIISHLSDVPRLYATSGGRDQDNRNAEKH
jgi:hypothetical protein